MAMENKPTIQQIIATWWILCMYMYIAPDMQNIRAQVKVVAPAHIPVMHRWKLWHLHTFQSCFDSIKPFNAIKGVSYRIKAWNCHKTHREAIITECLFGRYISSLHTKHQSLWAQIRIFRQILYSMKTMRNPIRLCWVAGFALISVSEQIRVCARNPPCTAVSGFSISV